MRGLNIDWVCVTPLRPPPTDLFRYSELSSIPFNVFLEDQIERKGNTKAQ